MITVRVPLGDRSYDVLVGNGVRSELSALLPVTMMPPPNFFIHFISSASPVGPRG